MDPTLIYFAKTDLSQYSTKDLVLLARSLDIATNVARNDLEWLLALNLSSKYQRAEMKGAEQYQKLLKLGSGAQGEVWVGKDANNKGVVIKIINKPQKPTKKFAQMILKERYIPQILKQANCHPNIACFIEFITTPDRYLIISKYVPGKDLLRAKLPSDPTQLVEIALKLSQAFEYMHQLGVAHRDIKAGNVILGTAKNEPIVIDFGLACLRDDFGSELMLCENANVFVGTPNFVAPELLVPGPRPDFFATDVYSLGVLYFYLFNEKRLPIKIKGIDKEEMYKAKILPPKKSKFNPAIDELIADMIQVNPADRPTMTEVRERLEEAETYSLSHLFAED